MKKVYVVSILLLFIAAILSFSKGGNSADNLDNQLYAVLHNQNFTGEIQKQLEIKLGRKLDKRKIELGRLIFFDKGLGLHQDNTCAGCHAPAFGFGDSQPIAIGVDNNDTVGVHRKGPRNQRRSPSVMNTAFFPGLMWNDRFKSLTNDPFNNSLGYQFPSPEGDSLFSITYNYVRRAKHLLVAQAHIPFTELPEMAGFTSTANKPIAFSRFAGLNKNDKNKPFIFSNKKTKGDNINSVTCTDPDFSVFDDGHGLPVPPVDPHYNSQNFGIRAEVLNLLNTNAAYKLLFKEIYPVVAQQPINFIMVGEVVAEFEFSLTFAKAPLDKFAVGNKNALSESEKRGALIFFGKGNCVSCHAVSGASNQMFSDFTDHNAGTPQIYPVFGLGTGNVPFSDVNCPGKTATGTLDYGREEFTGNNADRYKFRSSPLRNAILQSSYFHNGSFKDLKAAIKYHLDPKKNISSYSPNRNGVPTDLKYRASDMPAVMATIDPALRNGILLTEKEIDDLYNFVRDGLYDDNASPEKMKKLIPESVPSGVKVAFFEDNENGEDRISEPVNSSAGNASETGQLNAKLISNPTQNSFTIILPASDNNMHTQMVITDLNGTVIEKRSFMASGQTIQFGQNYQKGVFFAELSQGEKKISFKLIKM
jgi:cytochrome c peroxidase